MSLLVEVVDCVLGRPVAGLPVQLLSETGSPRQEPAPVTTDEAGCAWPPPVAARPGRYRLVVSLDGYFAGLGYEPCQSRTEFVFRLVHPGERVRLLLLVTPTSCAMYRLGPAATESSGAAAQ